MRAESLLKTTLVLLLCIILSSPAIAATGNEYIWTDNTEYLKGDTASIFGTGFASYIPIVIKVTRPDASVVTGDGTETPGSDTIVTNVDGNFAYSYYINGIIAEGTYTIEAIDTAPEPDEVLATVAFLDKAQFLLQGCSWSKGNCTESALPAWANGVTPMKGWTSGVLKGWFELDNVPYRLRVNLPKTGDAGTYYVTNEHDNLRGGVTGIDNTIDYYVGKLSDGALTKTCTFQAVRTAGDNPTSLNPCIVSGHTYTGVNDDPANDTNIDEETTDGIDNDLDGLIDEDPAGSSSPAKRIQDTWAVLFLSGEAGSSSSKWALYWKAHLAAGSSGFPGASLHANSTASGAQDVPIKNVKALPIICGNGVLEAGEQCDDGNNTSNDGCSAACIIEYCGDGVVHSGLGEQCDDGNNVNGDGCSATCQLEPAPPLCGNGIPEVGEQCDDGNTISGDGCSAACISEYCGDGVIQPGLSEQCDDGNNINGDGCSATCQLEPPPPAADLFINKSYTGTPNPGKTLSFVIQYGNNGSANASSVVVTDDYDQDYIIPSNICCGGFDDGNKITWLPGTVSAGSGPFSLTYDGKIHDGTPDTNAHMPIGDTQVVNTAIINTTSSDNDLSDNVSTVDILVHAEPNLFVTKNVNSSSSAYVKRGDTVNIILTYGNSDNNDAPNTTLCDDYNQTYLAPIAASISPGGVDDGDKICWGLTPDTLPGVLPGTRTLPGIDPQVSYQALVINSPVNWNDPASISTSDPEPAFKLANNTAYVYYLVEKPTAIRLLSFDALYSSDGNIISWRTGTEVNTEGFYILRATSRDGSYEMVTRNMIISRGQSFIGSSYSISDPEGKSVCSNTHCFYKLMEIEDNGNRVMYGPVLALGQEKEQEIYTNKNGTTTHQVVAANVLNAVQVTDENTEKRAAAGTAHEDYLDDVEPYSSLILDESWTDLKGETSDNRPAFVTEQAGDISEDSYNIESTISFKIIETDGDELSVAMIDKKTCRHSESVLGSIIFKEQKKEALHTRLDDSRIVLEWCAYSPVNGFNILRSTKKEGPYEIINKNPIPYPGVSPMGDIYEYIFKDANIDANEDYYYRIETLPELLSRVTSPKISYSK